jgi:hypothetical protein
MSGALRLLDIPPDDFDGELLQAALAASDADAEEDYDGGVR